MSFVSPSVKDKTIWSPNLVPATFRMFFALLNLCKDVANEAFNADRLAPADGTRSVDAECELCFCFCWIPRSPQSTTCDCSCFYQASPSFN